MLHSETPVLKSHAGSLKVCECIERESKWIKQTERLLFLNTDCQSNRIYYDRAWRRPQQYSRGEYAETVVGVAPPRRRFSEFATWVEGYQKNRELPQTSRFWISGKPLPGECRYLIPLAGFKLLEISFPFERNRFFAFGLTARIC